MPMKKLRIFLLKTMKVTCSIGLGHIIDVVPFHSGKKLIESLKRHSFESTELHDVLIVPCRFSVQNDEAFFPSRIRGGW